MNPSTPSPNGTCQFFRLPAEFRNIIYEFALSQPTGVVCREEPRITPGLFRLFPSTATIESASDKLHGVAPTTVQAMVGHETLLKKNQLKYCCRQLNNDIKALIITYSNLVFEQSVDEIVGFLKALTVSLHSCLGTLSIQDHTTYSRVLTDKPAPEWADLVKLCKAIPTIKVRVRLIGYGFYSILCKGMVLEKIRT